MIKKKKRIYAGKEDGQSRDGKKKENSVERLPWGRCQEVGAEVEEDAGGRRRSRPSAWDNEETWTRPPLEQHTQLGLRLQTPCDPFQKLPPPMPTCSDSTGAHGGCRHPCLWRAREDLSGNALVFLLPNLEKFFEKSLMGGKRPHTKLKRSSLGHIHNICLKPSLVKKDPTSPEGLCHHGQAALGAFSLTAGSITAPMGTTTLPLILGPLGIMWSVGGHLNHEQICSGGGKKTAAQRSYAHGL